MFKKDPNFNTVPENVETRLVIKSLGPTNPHPQVVLKRKPPKVNITTRFIPSCLIFKEEAVIVSIILSFHFSLFIWFALNDPATHLPCLLDVTGGC